ncbi:MAG: GAF domain-containing protein [Alsobacter sp.]
MDTPIPSNERRRLEQLTALDILDTEPSPGFDRVCTLAQEFFKVSAAMVSFVDTDRQWFKAKIGTELTGSTRSAAFCAHTIMADEILVVRDALADPRFASSPIVTGEPWIRFYAGAPIMLSPGIRLGAVCIVDRRPRTLDTSGRAVLKQLAEVAISELRLILAARAYFRRGFANGGRS